MTFGILALRIWSLCLGPCSAGSALQDLEDLESLGPWGPVSLAASLSSYLYAFLR